MRELLRVALDTILGAHCPASCGTRVFPRDLPTHLDTCPRRIR